MTHEETIKELKIGNRTLLHQRYVDSLGFKRDALEIVEMDSKGFLTRIPFFGDLKVRNYTKENIMDTTVDYTEEEYLTILNKK